ncbi:MAG: hypothetical protein M3P06_20090 [Acidobacteriota bacterium]|nr:hypothetical protein [Acidobacteriota bacterium]
MTDKVLTRNLLINALRDWQSGEMTAQEVQELAESFTDSSDFPESPPEDDRSIEVEVLMHLDALSTLPVTRADIPAILQFLSTPPGEALNGWAAWISYWESQNDADRRAEVAGDPFYAV